MLFTPRIRTKALAGLSRRLATSLEAGVDARRVFAQEVGRATGLGARGRLQAVSDAVQHGESISNALGAAEDYFPPLFLEMTRVGEEAGQLSETFALLAEHYEGRVRLGRVFLASLVWPLIELTLALVVVGLLIWVQGVIGQAQAAKVDILGFGLTGNSGLVVYLVFVGAVAVAVALFVRALARGALWTRPIQRLAVVLPGIGMPLKIICLARLAWSMHLTFKTGMDVRRALRLSFQSTNNAYFSDHVRAVEGAVAAGDSLADAFEQTGVFPAEFLNTLRVAEESGRVAESMAHLSRQYLHQAEVAMTVIATMGGFAIWGLVAIFIILMIFRVASFYFSTLQSFT